MKTKIVKVTLALFTVTGAIALSSFTTSKVESAVVKTEITTVKGNTDYEIVRTFVEENITTPIREQGKSNGVKMKSFSRCPSGYQSRIATKYDSVRTNIFVHGKIVLYKGCSPSPVCDFRVCVDKGIAEVKNKGEKEYITLREWMEDYNGNDKQEDVKTVKETPKEIKG